MSRFEEVNNAAEILERREKAFQGSQVQFFRNLANKDWGQEKFLLFNDTHNLDPNARFSISKEDDIVKVKILPQRKGEMKNEETSEIISFLHTLLNRKSRSIDLLLCIPNFFNNQLNIN